MITKRERPPIYSSVAWKEQVSQFFGWMVGSSCHGNSLSHNDSAIPSHLVPSAPVSNIILRAVAMVCVGAVSSSGGLHAGWTDGWTIIIKKNCGFSAKLLPSLWRTVLSVVATAALSCIVLHTFVPPWTRWA